MKHLTFLSFLLLAFFACKNNPSTNTNADAEAIAQTVHQFYGWYEKFVMDTTKQHIYVNLSGKYAVLDSAKLEKYYDQLRESQLLSEEYFANDKAYLQACEPIWKQDGMEGPLAGLDFDRVFNAQDWDGKYMTTTPLMVEMQGTERAKAVYADTTEAAARNPKFELKKENGKWLISKIDCGYVPVDDTGVYQSTESTCPMQLELSKTEGQYYFSLRTATRNQKGRIELLPGDPDPYFTLKGIKGNTKSDLEFTIKDGTIAFQNYGNSMNEFLYFKECDAKYVTLNKVSPPIPDIFKGKKPAAPPPPAAKPKAPAAKPLPSVTVDKNGTVKISGKTIPFDQLKKGLQSTLLTYNTLPESITAKSIGEVGMGTRHEVQTLIDEALAGAKWLRKKAALEALNNTVSSKLSTPTKLEVVSYKTSGNYALLRTRPLQPNGAPVNYSYGPYAALYNSGKLVERANGLMKYENGAWKMLVYNIGTDELPTSTWMKKYGAPKAVFVE